MVQAPHSVGRGAWLIFDEIRATPPASVSTKSGAAPAPAAASP